jgi:hypothetical protein
VLINIEEKERNLLNLAYKEFKSTELYKSCLGISLKRDLENFFTRLNNSEMSFFEGK